MRRKWRKKGGRPTPAIRRDDTEEYVTPDGGLPVAPAYVSTISRPDEKTFVGQPRRPISSAQTRFVGTLSYRRMRLMVGTAGDFWWPPSALCTAGYVRDPPTTTHAHMLCATVQHTSCMCMYVLVVLVLSTRCMRVVSRTLPVAGPSRPRRVT